MRRRRPHPPSGTTGSGGAWVAVGVIISFIILATTPLYQVGPSGNLMAPHVYVEVEGRPCVYEPVADPVVTADGETVTLTARLGPPCPRLVVEFP